MRRLRLVRETLSELELARVGAGAAAPSYYVLACLSAAACESVLEPCYETSECSLRCP